MGNVSHSGSYGQQLRQGVEHLQEKLGISERRACGVIGQCRATQRRVLRPRDDEEALRAAIVTLATRYGRYGYRRITALLRRDGWRVNHERVERLWRQEGLKVPQKQPKRGRLWLNDGSCVRLRPTHCNHVWSYDFVADRTRDGAIIILFFRVIFPILPGSKSFNFLPRFRRSR